MKTVTQAAFCALFGAAALAGLPKDPFEKISRFTAAPAAQFLSPAPVAISARVDNDGVRIRIVVRGHGFPSRDLFAAAAERAREWRRLNPKVDVWWEDSGFLEKNGSVVWSIYYSCGP